MQGIYHSLSRLYRYLYVTFTGPDSFLLFGRKNYIPENLQWRFFPPKDMHKKHLEKNDGFTFFSAARNRMTSLRYTSVDSAAINQYSKKEIAQKNIAKVIFPSLSLPQTTFFFLPGVLLFLTRPESMSFSAENQTLLCSRPSSIQ